MSYIDLAKTEIAWENRWHFATPPVVFSRNNETTGGVAKCRLFSQAKTKSEASIYTLLIAENQNITFNLCKSRNLNLTDLRTKRENHN